MLKVFLRKNISSRLQKGHAWVFANEIGDRVGKLIDGGIVNVYTSTGSFIGRGLYAATANIAIRMYTTDMEQDLDLEFFKQSFQKACNKRNAWNITPQVYRWVDGETDGLGGLYIAVINSKVIVQCLTQGMDQRYELIEKAIESLGFSKENILKDNSHTLRKYEQLSIHAPTPINETVRVLSTNFHIENIQDWSFERMGLCQFLASLVHEKVCIDLFSGNGTFSKIALSNGATKVYAVELDGRYSSSLKNIQNDYTDRFTYIAENVFDFWKKHRLPEQADIIIIDPPVFNPSEKVALQPYKELLLQAIKNVAATGVILMGNSHFKIAAAEFESMIQSAILDTKKSQIKYQKIPNSLDVQAHWLYEHTDAVKFYVLTNF